jgi:hypothetical protein
VLQPIEAASRRDSREQVRRRECEIGQAERICRVRLLSGDASTAGPLIAAIVAGECDRADDPVAVHDGRSHVEIEAAVRFVASVGQGLFQLRVAREVPACTLR